MAQERFCSRLLAGDKKHTLRDAVIQAIPLVYKAQEVQSGGDPKEEVEEASP